MTSEQGRPGHPAGLLRILGGSATLAYGVGYAVAFTDYSDRRWLQREPVSSSRP